MLSSATLASGTTGRTWPAWAAPLALFLGAALLYSINLGRMQHPDELHHILAARGMLATGEPRIAEGLYTRGLLFTWLVAQSFALFGESLSAARLPSLLAMAALVPALFVWLRREAGALAAWIGAGLFAVSPFAVDMAQFSRFYALQMLGFFLAAILTYGAVEAGPPLRRLGLALGALAALMLAATLQPTTLLGLAGLGLWLAGVLLLPVLLDPGIPARRKLWLLGGLLGLSLLLVLALAASGMLAELWRLYRFAPLFNRSDSNEFWYYHAWYSLLYPSLWPATGLLAITALAAWPRPASLLLSVFAVGFLLNSFAASKSLRYITYAQPFLFGLWGMGLAALAAGLGRFLADLRARLGLALAGAPGAEAIARGLVVAALAFLVLANPAWLRSATLLAGIAVPPEKPSTNWPAARAALLPWLERADVVVSNEELGTLYFLGRYDIRYSASKLEELPPGQQHDFGIDPRTGRPVIASNEALEKLFQCYDTGLFVGPVADFGVAHKMSLEMERLIAAYAKPVELPRESRVYAYAWQRPPGQPKPAACAALPPIRRTPLLPPGR
jgi:hypothetical protein